MRPPHRNGKPQDQFCRTAGQTTKGGSLPAGSRSSPGAPPFRQRIHEILNFSNTHTFVEGASAGEDQTPATRTDGANATETLCGDAGELRRQLIELCVVATRLMGLPRSVGEIYGFIFTSTEPVSFEAVVKGLDISAGSASHGLRWLRRTGAVRSVYLARDRREYYVAETSLHAFAHNFLGESVFCHLAASHERLTKLQHTLKAASQHESQSMASKLDMLLDWHQQASKAMSVALAAIR